MKNVGAILIARNRTLLHLFLLNYAIIFINGSRTGGFGTHSYKLLKKNKTRGKNERIRNLHTHSIL